MAIKKGEERTRGCTRGSKEGAVRGKQCYSAELRAVKDELEAKKEEILVLSERVRKLEKERCMFAYVVAGCAAAAMYVRLWM